MLDWLNYGFMQQAFITLLFASPIFGLLGSLVVVGKMSFFSDALGHSAFTGLAIGTIFGISTYPVLTSVLFSTLFAIAMVLVKLKSRSANDTIIGVFSASLSALGITVLSITGQTKNYATVLMGDILTISKLDIIYIIVLFAFTLIVWSIVSNMVFLTLIDKGIAKSKAINTLLIEIIYTVLLAVLVAVSLKWIGLLLINSFLILPAASAKLLAKNLSSFHWYSVFFATFSALAGLILSFYLGLPSSALIVILLSIIFFILIIGTKHNARQV